MANRYACDYARLGTSSCKKCKQKLEKGSLRLAKLSTNPFGDGDGDMKMYYHAKCMFETFVRARATTKVIDDMDDIEGFADLKEADKQLVQELINDLAKQRGTPKKATPKKATLSKAAAPASSTTSGAAPAAASSGTAPAVASSSGAVSTGGVGKVTDRSEWADKDNSFRMFRKLCADVAEENSHTGKTAIINKYITKGNSGAGFEGDLYLVMKLLLPQSVKTVYNMHNKQLCKVFSQIFGASLDKMNENVELGDISETVRIFYEASNKCPPQSKSNLSIAEVDDFLEELSKYTKEEDQQSFLTKIVKRCTSNDLKVIVRLIKHDLRINAGPSNILAALDSNAYDAYKASRNLRDVVDRVLRARGKTGDHGELNKKLSIRASLMTPVQPMLAEACKSVEMALKKCPNGMFAEIKYDGERLQLHKKGDTFQYYSRSLKQVQPHKVVHFKEFIPKAFPNASDLILDSEVLLIDTKTKKPLPFGSLGVHKKNAFKDANVCLFVFDCLHYNGENLMNKPIKERRKILQENMTEIENRILFSEMKHINAADDLADLMMKVFREGLEGLVLKDVNSIYEPGKRHWLKVKKDYLAAGAMADTADLVVLGGYFGTGSKGGIMSCFLMGVHDPDTDRWCTVTKCSGGFDDATLDKLQKSLKMNKISKDPTRVPAWLNVNKNLIPDFVTVDPKNSAVFEVTGAEFSKSDAHTAGGISIRFPRCTKIRDDKSWKEATDLPRLKELFEKSKEYSDIQDVLRPGRATPKKNKRGSDEDNDEEDEDEEYEVGKKQKNTPKKRKKPASSGSSSDTDDEGDWNSKSPAKKPSAMNNTSASTAAEASALGGAANGDRSANNARGGAQVDTRPQCKYGAACYQKNPDHRKNFSHSTASAAVTTASSTDMTTTSSKSSEHLPDFLKGLLFYVSPENTDFANLKRYIIAYDGDVVGNFEKSSATYVVIDKSDDDDKSGRCVTSDWLRQCFKQKKLLPRTMS